MDDIVLKRMAMRSLMLMFAVLVISASCSQYSGIEIFAHEKKTPVVVETSALDVANIDDKEKNLKTLSSMDGKVQEGTPDELLSDKYIMIKKPLEDNLELSLEDCYMERSIKLTVNGLSAENIGYESITRKNELDSFVGKPIATGVEDVNSSFLSNDYAKNMTIEYDHSIEKETYTATITMELDGVYVYTLYQDDENYYINMQKPKDVYDKIIVVDAGHGGNDVGTFPTGMEYVEKDMNLSVVLYLKQLLDQENIKVYYTRLTDVKPYLRPRVRLANDLDADLFISVHCNGSDLTQPSGTEVLYNEKSRVRAFGSKKLAQICLDEVTKVMNSRNRGIVSGSEKFIIGHSKVPVALIELAYLTNPDDLDYLKNPDNRKDIAKGIYNGIMRFYQEQGEKGTE